MIPPIREKMLKLCFSAHYNPARRPSELKQPVARHIHEFPGSTKHHNISIHTTSYRHTWLLTITAIATQVPYFDMAGLYTIILV